MKLKACLAAVALAAGIAAGAPAVAEVSVVQVPSNALAHGATYAWASISGVTLGTPTPAIINEITAQRLAMETDSVLSSKGYRLAPVPSEADLIVTYHVLMEPKLDTKLDRAGRCLRAVLPRRDGLSPQLVHEDPGHAGSRSLRSPHGQLLYRATSEKEISSKDTSAKRLNSVLKQMTKSLPS